MRKPAKVLSYYEIYSMQHQEGRGVGWRVVKLMR